MNLVHSKEGTQSSGERRWGCSIQDHPSADTLYDIYQGKDSNDDNDALSIPTFKPRRNKKNRAAQGEQQGADFSKSMGPTKHSSIMMQLLDDDKRKREDMGRTELMLECAKDGFALVLGEKKTKERKLRLAALVFMLFLVVAVSVLAGLVFSKGSEEVSNGGGAIGFAPVALPLRPSPSNGPSLSPSVVKGMMAKVRIPLFI